MSYGAVALSAGSMRAARQVGAILRALRDDEDDVPWQRVVNAQGGVSTFKVGIGELQVALLRREGVEVGVPHRIDMARYAWSPVLAELAWFSRDAEQRLGG